MKRIITIFLAAGFLVVLAGLWQAFSFLSSAPGAGDSARIFEVRRLESFHSVADRLVSEKMVSSAFWLRVYARFLGADRKLQAGEYELRENMRPVDILEVFSSGKVFERSVTFPEGINIYEMASELEAKGVVAKNEFLRLAREPRLIQELLGEAAPSLEGFLFPETYKYTKYGKYPVAEGLIRTMVAKFNEVYSGIAKSGEFAKWTRRQIVTMASVIEKETGAPEERPLISSVFHNRLAKGMRLQSDPTIIYGLLVETGELKKNITRDDITHPTPYNTYTVARLPVGPIANPGRESLAAVFAPAKSNNFYFVSRNDGTHVFSENFASHNSAVRSFQVNPEARKGKSWRDLKGRKPKGQAVRSAGK
jgi:UPF0755 protein